MSAALSDVERELIADAKAASTNGIAADASDGRRPPCDLDTEATVLASVMIDPASYPKISSFLKPEHFYSEAHRRIFEACAAVHERGVPVDLVVVLAELKDRDRLEQVGGSMHVIEIASSAPAIVNVAQYAKIVLDKFRVRSAIKVCQETAARGYFDYGDPQAFIDEHTRAITAIGRLSATNEIESNAKTLRRLVKSIVASSTGVADADRGRTGILTGLRGYDALVHGLHAGEKTLIVALPKVGKTALVLQILAHVASTGIGTALFCQEMPRDQLFIRLLSARATVDGDRLKGAKAGVVQLTQQEIDRLEVAEAYLAGLPLVIDYCPGINRDQLRSRVMMLVDEMRVMHKVPLGLVALDYIQRMPGLPQEQAAVARGQMKKHDYITKNANAFTTLLQDLKIPGIELAQRKNSPVDPKTKQRVRPAAGQTADSSDIEKEASQIVYLYRLPKKDPAGMRVIGEDKERVGMLLAEQRNGKTGEAILRFEGQYSRFSDAPDERLVPASRQFIQAPPPDDDDDDDQRALLPRERRP